MREEELRSQNSEFSMWRGFSLTASGFHSWLLECSSSAERGTTGTGSAAARHEGRAAPIAESAHHQPGFALLHRIPRGGRIQLFGDCIARRLVASGESTIRIPLVSVRVGDYAFDNTNHIFSEAYSGSRYDPDRLALDDDYLGFRHALWLATDRAYKTAEDAIARKRSSLKNMNLPEQIPDFSKAPPVKAVLPVHRQPVNEALWKDRAVKLSAIFDAYPKVLVLRY